MNRGRAGPLSIMDRGPWIPPAPAHTSTALLVVVVGCRRLSSRLHPTHASTQHEEQFGSRQEGRKGEWRGARGVWPARGFSELAHWGGRRKGRGVQRPSFACTPLPTHVYSFCRSSTRCPLATARIQEPEHRTAPTVWRTRAGELERREPQCRRPQHRLCRSVNALLLFTSQDINKL